jgi:hypothetical protein
MKKTISILALGIASANMAYAEPTWYGNLNLNANYQENFDPTIDDAYLDSNYSYLGLAGQEKTTGGSTFVNRIKYRVEFKLDINDEDNPLQLHQAVGAMDTVYGDLLMGHQTSIQSDILLKPMDVFKASRVVALEESAYVEEVTKNTIRLDTSFLGMHLSVSASMDNPDPESETIDTYSVGLITKTANSQYGVVYWEDNDWENATTVGYRGVNASYNSGMWGVSASYVNPTINEMPDTSDFSFVLKMADGMRAKAKFGTLEGEWQSSGVGVESSLTKRSKWYLEYQRKDFDDKELSNQSLYSFGVDYKF